MLQLPDNQKVLQKYVSLRIMHVKRTPPVFLDTVQCKQQYVQIRKYFWHIQKSLRMQWFIWVFGFVQEYLLVSCKLQFGARILWGGNGDIAFYGIIPCLCILEPIDYIQYICIDQTLSSYEINELMPYYVFLLFKYLFSF